MATSGRLALCKIILWWGLKKKKRYPFNPGGVRAPHIISVQLGTDPHTLVAHLPLGGALPQGDRRRGPARGSSRSHPSPQPRTRGGSASRGAARGPGAGRRRRGGEVRASGPGPSPALRPRAPGSCSAWPTLLEPEPPSHPVPSNRHLRAGSASHLYHGRERTRPAVRRRGTRSCPGFDVNLNETGAQ